MRKIHLCILSIILFACASKVTTSVMMPAGSSSFTKIRSVAVLQFSGNFGAECAKAAENVLVRTEVKGEKYFTVADRKTLDKVMSEQKFQLSGAIDNSTVVKLGKLTGVYGILTGSAEKTNSSERYTESRSKCVSSDKKGKCQRYSEYNVSCIKKSVNIEFMPRLIDVASGLVVYSDSLRGYAEDSSCSDNSSPALSEKELANQALDNSMSQFRKRIAPYEMDITLSLMSEKDGVTDSGGASLLKSSLSFAEEGRLDRACSMWEEGYTKYPSSISFAYNYGVCAEIQGNYNKASELYYAADKLAKEPEKMINQALVRIGQRIKDSERLKDQL